MNGRIRTSVIHENAITKNSLIKLLTFSKYESEDVTAIHVKTISVISQDPGHKFGNPVYYFDFFSPQDDDDSHGVVDGDDDAIENEISRELMERKSSIEKEPEKDYTLQELYSCRFAAHEKPIHSKIPSNGWKKDAHGLEPVPRTQWIPGPAPRRPLGPNNGRI